jgi:hypothetical protein
MIFVNTSIYINNSGRKKIYTEHLRSGGELLELYGPGPLSPCAEILIKVRLDPLL